MLRVTGPEATNACQDDYLCAGSKAGIDGAIQGVQFIWDANSSTEYWGLLLVDSKNALNKINKIGILWTVRLLWLSGARFVFNCYYHCSLLVLRNGNGTSSFMHGR